MQRFVANVIACAVALAAATAAAPSVRVHGSRTASLPGYGWPIAPFDQIHPIRANFGDPRTTFAGPPTPATLMAGTGQFSFHNGVDISAPDGTAVYAVASGTVVTTAARKVVVRSPGRRVFQYWHIIPTVHDGQQVTAFVDVLGRIRTTYAHVHLVESRGGRTVNPLARGHLTPYRDETKPVIERLQFRRQGSFSELVPELLKGVVEIDAPVFDVPRPSAPGEWSTMVTAPAFVSWHVERARDHARRTSERVVFDVRARLPKDDFWNVYARGTRQNDPTFQQHRYWRQQGVFLYRLGTIDTRVLPDGIYAAVVTAKDVRGNSATRSQTFLVYNHRLWPPPTDQA